MRRHPRRLNRPAQKRAGRTFAVGPRDMEHRRQIEVRIAQAFQQRRNTRQPQDILAG